MRSRLSLVASALAAAAAVVASEDGDVSIVPFFVTLTFLGGVQAWAAHPPFRGPRAWVARAAAWLWAGAAAWAGILLLWYLGSALSSPPPAQEATYLGLTATVYHVAGLFGGAVLALAAAHGPARWLDAPRGYEPETASAVA
jgi:hypothetical protein